MELENQLVSLELAKKLKELEVKQESLFVWIRRKPETANEEPFWYLKQEGSWPAGMKLYDRVSAFTVAELGEMLPFKFKLAMDNSQYFTTWKNKDNSWSVKLFGTHISSANTEANARAKMLIYLLEQGIIKV